MRAIKSYTDIEQSKKLAEFLSLESADMCFANDGTSIKIDANPYNTRKLMWENVQLIPCWSLAALLGVLEHPRCFQGDKPIYWFCGCFGKDNLYHEVEADNPVDACYKMILELNKLELL